jgi:FdhE protein
VKQGGPSSVAPGGQAGGLIGGGELGEVPYLRPHPGPVALFNRRAARFAALAPDHATADYLLLLSKLAAAQRVAAERLKLPTLAPASPGALPLDPSQPPPPAWREALALLLGELAGVELPPPARAALERLGRLAPPDLDGVAARLRALAPAPLDVPVALFIGAALQVVFTGLAAGLPAATVARVEDDCPVCGAPPACGQVLGDDKLRYLVCGLCATSWHRTRAQCVLCRSSETLSSLSVEGDAGPARAECCGGCQAYLKLLYVERGPALEPLCDDVATLALDLLVGERGYSRLGQNPYLVVAEGTAEA